MGETRAQEGKEVQEKSALPPPKPVEQPARKIPSHQAEPIQEATLRKDLPKEVTEQKATNTGSSRETPQLAKETPAGAPGAGEQRWERAKENGERGLRATNIESVKPAGQAKPAEAASEVRVALKSVEGYAVQLSFPQKIDAQRWSETLSREGYTTSITSIGETDPVRLRVGSFSSPEAAKTLLGRLQRQGLTGFVIQVPKG
jgi:cell division septation protein DedD